MKTEVLVIGSGLAGSIAALTAAEAGKQVTIITKTSDLMSGSTPHAQGGIIYRGENDSKDKLKEDILMAGDGASWEPAVDQLVEMGPRLVKELLIDKFQVNFDYTSEYQLDLTEEGAHSVRRIIHSKDKTGYAIHEKIIPHIRDNPNITILTDHTAIDLLTLSHHSTNPLDIYLKPTCFGAFVMNNKTKEIFPIYAQNTILATGGLGQIYINTTNPPENTGDGISLAYRAGARIFNLHYIQFHPTTFYGAKERFLISESVRGEGGILLDCKGNRFMQKYHELAELAPRDVVARAIYDTMLETNHPCVYLDISHKNSEWIRNRFPTIYAYLLKNGIDMTIEPIPVVPAAHYSCGGVGVNLKGRTSLRRLWAVGEVSCTGVHGANRLASTSLLEALVWGYIAGNEVSKPDKEDDYFPQIFDWVSEVEDVDNALIAQDWLTIKNTMWNYVGLIRTRQRLLRAHQILRHLQTEIESFYRRARMSPEVIQLRNGVITAYAVTNSAMEDRVSRGAHYLKD
ncbi:MAG TPA: L-aspartate oxidase [Bacteroidota bacterium]|nr:L-aspartate oxidase [Candidatus Kapabacteria bacterium]HRS01996.1 L-aspartate oxidase [Bacteroidota bacterium]